MTIVITMCKLLFAMALGYYLNKKDLLTPMVSRKMSSIVVDVTVPLLIINSMGSVSGGEQKTVLTALFSGALLYAVFPLVGLLVCRILHPPKGTEGVYQCMLMFANTAFMGYPVIQALYGSTSIFYTSIFNFGYNILFFSYAAFLIDKDAGASSRFEPKRLLSVGVIVGVLTIVMYFTGIKLPAVILEPCGFVGNITTPMSMLIIGSNMANYSLKEMFGEWRLYIMTLLRLIVMPVLTVLYLKVWTDNALLIAMCAMTIGMPIGSMLAMATSKYELQGKIGSMAVVMTTLCSMVTIPVLALVFKVWLGV